MPLEHGRQPDFPRTAGTVLRLHNPHATLLTPLARGPPPRHPRRRASPTAHPHRLRWTSIPFQPSGPSAETPAPRPARPATGSAVVGPVEAALLTHRRTRARHRDRPALLPAPRSRIHIGQWAQGGQRGDSPPRTSFGTTLCHESLGLARVQENQRRAGGTPPNQRGPTATDPARLIHLVHHHATGKVDRLTRHVRRLFRYQKPD